MHIVGSVPPQIAEAGTTDIVGGSHMEVFQYRFTSSEVVPLKKLVSNATLTSSRVETVTLLSEERRSNMASLRNCSEREFEVFLKDGKICKCFLKSRSYGCVIPEAEDMFSIRHRAGKHQPCVRCTVKFKDIIRARESPNQLLSTTTETRKNRKFPKDCWDGEENISNQKKALAAKRDIKLAVRAASGGMALDLGVSVRRDCSGNMGFVLNISL